MILTVRDNQLLKVGGDPGHPANAGRLCAKGLSLIPTIGSTDRLRYGFYRASREAALQRQPMDRLISQAALRLKRIVDAWGPQAVAFYVSGQLSTETQYVANKFCKGFIGCNNIDSNSRLCMSSAASGYKLSLGADAPPGSYEDIEHADCFLVIGSNMADCHPILFQRALDRRRKAGGKLIVVDPRRTATAEKADLFLQIKSGSDLALLNGLLHLLIRRGAVDEAFMARHTEGWEELRVLARDYSPEKVSSWTGLSKEDLEHAAACIAEAREWMSFWTMGLNQSAHGTWNANALINLHLATGKICRAGSGPFSLTGQPNAMGGREMGYFGDGLPGQRSVTCDEDRAWIERIWKVPSGRIQAQPGPDAVTLFRQMAEGKIRAVWIIGTNPVASMPNRRKVIEGLQRAELVIVQDAYHPTETSKYADILLPGALWAEAEGTMINSDRMATWMPQALRPEGDILPDWELLSRTACAMGFHEGFAYRKAEEIFEEIKQCWNPATGYDLRGMDYGRLRQKPLQWPCGPGAGKGSVRRYIGPEGLRFPTASGKARLWARPHVESGEATDSEFPWVLNTGRLAHQWHTLTKTGKVDVLNKLNPEGFVELHPTDAARLEISSRQSVRIVSRRGMAILPAKLSDAVHPGSCFVPFHWNDLFGEHLAINETTSDKTDPISFQPELKTAAVRLEKVVVEQPGEASPSWETEMGPFSSAAQRPMNSDSSFSREQKQYLEGLMAGIAQRGTFPFVGLTPDGKLSPHPLNGTPNLAASPTEQAFHGTPLSDLSREERWKYEENPLDSWDRLVGHAEKDQFPDPENTYRFKSFGLFHVAPAQNAFMLRCRIPAGILTSVQMNGLAEIAQEWGGGYADITTRANFQIREIAPRNILNVMGKLQDLGLTSRGAGADNVRNITASPLSGIDSAELFDCRNLAKALHNYILNHRDLYGLPRKFNVAFDGGGSMSVLVDTNDIGFMAVRVPEGAGVDPGVYFRAQLAGVTGHGQFAADSGILARPNECIALAAAMIRVFVENGDRANRKKARLKYLIDRWGVPKFLEETEKKLAFKLLRLPIDRCESRSPTLMHGHLGVYRQSQRRLNYIGAAIPVGRLKARQMKRLAEMAQHYGSGELRLSVFQNLILPNVSDAFVETVQRNLRWMGLDHQATSISGGLVACTGNTGCKFAATNTKGQAVELARALEKKVRLDQPINIHLTGCPHSCAQHYIGDIGLLGTKVGAGSDSVEGYHVTLGGGFDTQQALGREVFKSVPFSELPPLLERVLKTYQGRRHTGESFSEFTRRHSLDELKTLFSSLP